MREALKFVGGSCVVYVVMAACSTRRLELPKDTLASVGGMDSVGAGGTSSSNAGVPAEEGNSGMPGAMGMAGEVTATAGKPSGSSGSGPRDGGVMDAMTDPVPDAAAQEMSGSRLKARYYVGEDGSKQFIGWYDTQRKENCSFGAAADGKIRCIPTYSANAGSYFMDAACSQPLFVASTSSCISTGSYGYTFGSCNFNLYKLSKVSPSTVYIGSPAACSAASTASITSLDFFTGTEVPASSFVAATEQTE